MAAWMLPAAIGGSALLGAWGQQNANQMNAEMMRENNAFNAGEAVKNREFQAASASDAMRHSHHESRLQEQFQERMSSTAYQRGAEDLKKAGLNPMLAAMGSQASAPSGSSSSGTAASGAQASGSLARMENVLSGIGGSVSDAIGLSMQAAKLDGELGLQKAQKDNLNADTKKKGVETKVSEKDIPKSDLFNRIYDWAKDKLSEAEEVNAAKGRDFRAQDALKKLKKKHETQIPYQKNQEHRNWRF